MPRESDVQPSGTAPKVNESSAVGGGQGPLAR